MMESERESQPSSPPTPLPGAGEGTCADPIPDPQSPISAASDDPESLDLLDQYLSAVQAGQTPDREAILRRRPDLAPMLDCIDALEQLAPSVASAESESLAADDNAGFPRMFGPYELLGEIGRGGMGVVYKARQSGLERIVAVKMILGSHLASAEHVRRFQVEARAAAKLQHSSIVHIHEVGQIHGQHYFAMEHIDGESLAARLARGPLAPQEAAWLVAAVARAVEHLHQQGILHRDLKPSNILLDREGRPYVTDFGLAKIFALETDATATGVIAGTPSYMAPEQASPRGATAGPAADVYSLGAILYELLAGRPPFKEENPLDTLLCVLGSDPPPPRSINPKTPRALELICLKCLAKSPQDRYGSAAALAEELERYLRGEPLTVRPPRPAQRVASWARRQPALAMRLGTLGVFYLVQWCNYLTGSSGVDWGFHWRMSLLIAVWAAVAIVFQQYPESRRGAIPARFVWGLLDTAALLAALLLADGAASPLIVAYPILVVVSGLWFRVRFVFFMTVMSLLSYGLLVLDLYFRRPWLQEGLRSGFDRHVFFAVALIVTGATVAYLVNRVRTLSNFCGHPLS